MNTSADHRSRFEAALIAGLDDDPTPPDRHSRLKSKSPDRRSRLESYLIAALDDLAKPGDIAADIETYDPTPALGKGGARIPSALEKITDRFQSKVRLLQLYRQGGDQVWLLDMKAWEEEGMLDDAHLQPLRYILGSAERRIVGHGVTTFDAPWVWHHFRLRFARLADTLTAHRLLVGGKTITKTHNPELQGGLDRVLRFYLGFEYPSDQVGSDWGVEQLDAAQLEYAEHDVLYLHELLFRMEELIRLDRLQKAWGLEQRLAPVVVDMTNRGAPFDREGAIAAYQTVKPRLEAAEKAVQDWFGLPSLNLNSGHS